MMLSQGGRSVKLPQPRNPTAQLIRVERLVFAQALLNPGWYFVGSLASSCPVIFPHHLLSSHCTGTNSSALNWPTF